MQMRSVHLVVHGHVGDGIQALALHPAGVVGVVVPAEIRLGDLAAILVIMRGRIARVETVPRDQAGIVRAELVVHHPVEAELHVAEIGQLQIAAEFLLAGGKGAVALDQIGEIPDSVDHPIVPEGLVGKGRGQLVLDEGHARVEIAAQEGEIGKEAEAVQGRGTGLHEQGRRKGIAGFHGKAPAVQGHALQGFGIEDGVDGAEMVGLQQRDAVP